MLTRLILLLIRHFHMHTGNLYMFVNIRNNLRMNIKLTMYADMQNIYYMTVKNDYAIFR